MYHPAPGNRVPRHLTDQRGVHAAPQAGQPSFCTPDHIHAYICDIWCVLWCHILAGSPICEACSAYEASPRASAHFLSGSGGRGRGFHIVVRSASSLLPSHLPPPNTHTTSITHTTPSLSGIYFVVTAYLSRLGVSSIFDLCAGWALGQP